jgi:hypothetical protein
MSYKEFSARQDAIGSAQISITARDVPSAPSKKNTPPIDEPTVKPGKAPVGTPPPKS